MGLGGEYDGASGQIDLVLYELCCTSISRHTDAFEDLTDGCEGLGVSVGTKYIAQELDVGSFLTRRLRAHKGNPQPQTRPRQTKRVGLYKICSRDAQGRETF